MAKKTISPAINIDAQLVLVLNNYSEMSDKELNRTKSTLLKIAADYPEVAEPIQSILETIGLD